MAKIHVGRSEMYTSQEIEMFLLGNQCVCATTHCMSPTFTDSYDVDTTKYRCERVEYHQNCRYKSSVQKGWKGTQRLISPPWTHVHILYLV